GDLSDATGAEGRSVLDDCLQQAANFGGIEFDSVATAGDGSTDWERLFAAGVVLRELDCPPGRRDVTSVVDKALEASPEERRERAFSLMVFDTNEAGVKNPKDHGVVFVDLDKGRLVLDPRNRLLLVNAKETVDAARAVGGDRKST